MKRASLLLLAVLASTIVYAEDSAQDEDELRLESSVVTGNRELPKVMSIVPWKKSQPGELAGRPESSLLNEVLAPVDREVFRRQLRYYAQLTKQSDAAAADDQK